MEIFKTCITFIGYDEGYFFLADTIFYENQWWLVPTWLEANNKSEKIPERLVRLTGLRYQEVDGMPYRFLLNIAIPKSVFDGEEEEEGYVVANYPVLEHIHTSKSVH